MHRPSGAGVLSLTGLAPIGLSAGEMLWNKFLMPTQKEPG